MFMNVDITVVMHYSSIEQVVTREIYGPFHHFLPPKMAWNCWKFNW